MTASQVTVTQELSSEWPLLSDLGATISCHTATTTMPESSRRLATLARLGEALSAALRPDLPTIWILIASRTPVAEADRSKAYLARKRPALSEAHALNLATTDAYEFELPSRGGAFRTAAAFPLARDEWGKASALLFDHLAVGVALATPPTPVRLAELTALGLPDEPGTGRAHQLRSLLSQPDCVAVLTHTGAFDDPELSVELHLASLWPTESGPRADGTKRPMWTNGPGATDHGYRWMNQWSLKPGS